uniref:Pecanex-like protein n=1 Tax=Steinernema glaseri TaxID=37863 RepID=A0A1I7ZWZ0_9BILA
DADAEANESWPSLKPPAIATLTSIRAIVASSACGVALLGEGRKGLSTDFVNTWSSFLKSSQLVALRTGTRRERRSLVVALVVLVRECSDPPVLHLLCTMDCLDSGEAPPRSATLHVYFSSSPWESATTVSQRISKSETTTNGAVPKALEAGLSFASFLYPHFWPRVMLTTNPSSSSSSSAPPLNCSTNGSSASLHSMENTTIDDGDPDVLLHDRTRNEMATTSRFRSNLQSDVVDRWIELHFQPISACRVRSYIPPMFNIHTRSVSVDRQHRHRRSSRFPGSNGHLETTRPRSTGPAPFMESERTHILKIKKTTPMKRTPAMGASSSRLSRERRRSTPAFATLSGFIPTSTVSISLEPIPEATEEDERKDSGVVSASGGGSTNGIWSSMNDLSIKDEEAAGETESEMLCDRMCEEMAELPLSDQPSAEKLVMQSFATLAVTDQNRKIEGV